MTSTFNSKFSGGINSSPIGSPGGTALNDAERRNMNLRNKVRIGTWNVQSLYESGKLINLIQEMERLKIDILGVAETWWPDAGICEVSGGTMYYSGNQDKRHRKGVGIIVSEKFSKSVINFFPHSDRMALIKLNAIPINVNIIQVYAPTSDSTEDEIEAFYNELKQLLRLTKEHEINLILGDFNSKIGEGRCEELVGPYGLGIRNDRGERLYQFCQEENMKVTNTWFKLPPRRLYTWRAPADHPDNIVRNQIDYILINKRFGTSVTRACTYPGADVPSDHVLLVAEMKIKISNVKRHTQQRKIEYYRLKDDGIKNRVTTKIRDRIIDTVKPQIEAGTDINNVWEEMQKIVSDVAENEIGYKQKTRKKNWMTDEILELFEERRKYKNERNQGKYTDTQKVIRKKIRAAKNNWLKQQCEELERLQKLHDDFSLHKKIKETAGIYRKKTFSNIENDQGEIAQDDHQKKTIWENYINHLFADERPDIENKDDESLSGPAITTEEIRRAIGTAKDRKAVGPDQIPVEILKLLDDNGISVLQKIFNQIYNTGKFPDKWLTSHFIPLPKKNNATKCGDYRLISLISHTLKIFLKIIQYRITAKCERDMGSSQFGFRRGLGTREALVAIQVLVQKCYDQRKDVMLCFIDYEKAFDRVQHHKLVHILRRLDIDGKDIRCIENLYWNQTAEVRTGGQVTEAQKICRGVRQGCVLSPLLFNLYSEHIFQEALEDREIGIKVNGVWINNIRYADDTVLIADNVKDLQDLLIAVGEHSRNMGLNINTKKTKFMIVSRNSDEHQNAKIMHNNQSIDRVDRFNYLGTWLCENWSSDMEIRCRIEKARSAFMKFNKVFTSTDFDLNLRIRFIKSYVWSVLLYGVESWTLKVNTMTKLEAFEMWLYRRMLKIPWTARKTNEEILRMVQRDRELLTTIKRKKAAYLGHVIRNERYHLIRLIIEGKIEGKRGIGRRRMSWLRNIRQWTGMRNAGDLIHAGRDREDWANVIANIH